MSDERLKQLECLKDATKCKVEAQAEKKRDAKLHSEQISAIDQEIEEIMEQLADGEI